MYRVFQCAEDLRALVMRAGPAPLVRIARLVPGVNASAYVLAQTLDRVVQTDLRLPTVYAADVEACLLLAATHPEKDETAFQTATALLLADHIQNGQVQEDLSAHWNTFQDAYRQANAPVRAAIMQGFLLCHQMGRFRLDYPPEGEDLLTWPQREIERKLLDAAQAMTHAELAEEIRAGRRTGITRQLELLLEALTRVGGASRLPEAITHVSPDEADEPAYLTRLSLACCRALKEDAMAADLAKHWGQGADHILAQSFPAAAHLLAGFRHLFESRQDWNPYPGLDEKERQRRQKAIPWWLDPA